MGRVRRVKENPGRAGMAGVAERDREWRGGHGVVTTQGGQEWFCRGGGLRGPVGG